jgi:hypothetical protein
MATHICDEVFRSKEQVIISALFGLAVATVGIATAPEARTLAGALLQSCGCVALATLLVVGVGRCGVWVTQAGIRIRNPASTSVVAWSEVRGFRIGRSGLLGAVCIADLVDGSSRTAFAIQVPNRALGRSDSEARAIVARLNEILMDRQLSPSSDYR